MTWVRTPTSESIFVHHCTFSKHIRLKVHKDAFGDWRWSVSTPYHQKARCSASGWADNFTTAKRRAIAVAETMSQWTGDQVIMRGGAKRVGGGTP